MNVVIPTQTTGALNDLLTEIQKQINIEDIEKGLNNNNNKRSGILEVDEDSSPEIVKPQKMSRITSTH